MEKKLKIGIVGAGIQGISNGLFLQKKGFDVTIFDKDEPAALLHLMVMQAIFPHMLLFQ
jgi:glycine/D-amino acid oxidase-like deaminating enzyme